MRPILASILAATLLACSTPSAPPSESWSAVTGEFSLDEILNEKGAPGCRKMIDSYCSTLNGPDAQGNLRIGRGPSSLAVRRGRTRNDFSSAYYFFASAKLRARAKLPADFRSALEGSDYFGELSRSLSRRPRAEMDLESRVRAIRRDHDLDRIWNAAVSETVLRRMDRRHPGYHRLRDDLVPLEQAVEAKRVRRELVAEISRATWEGHPNWLKVEAGFETLRGHFLSVIDALDVPDEVRARWRERIRSVKLAIPGSIPAIADFECSATMANAYYYSHLNVITVCAGDFNSQDVFQTVAHELAHSLDLGRARYVFQRESELGRATTALRAEVCSPKRFACEGWRGFREKFDDRLAGLRGFEDELPEFQRCLKRRPTKAKPSAEDVRRIAEGEVDDQIADLAADGVFLRLTKERVPLPNGKTTRNPNYFNPCSYRTWSLGEEPVDDELTQLVFFTAEYRCSAEEDPKRRLRDAIAVAREMGARIAAETIAMEGEFSDRAALESEGYASSPTERFADVIGSYAFASYLRELSDPLERRYRFLASSSWQCERPSLASLYPEENTVQQGFVFDSHAETEVRKTEMFTLPVREALGCAEDFEFRACELGFRKPASARN